MCNYNVVYIHTRRFRGDYINDNFQMVNGGF